MANVGGEGPEYIVYMYENAKELNFLIERDSIKIDNEC